MISLFLLNDFFVFHPIELNEGYNLFGAILEDLVVTNHDKLKLVIKQYTPAILKYLKEKKEATTSKISSDLNIPYEDVLFVLKRLQENKLIVMS